MFVNWLSIIQARMENSRAFPVYINFEQLYFHGLHERDHRGDQLHTLHDGGARDKHLHALIRVRMPYASRTPYMHMYQ